MKKCIERKMGIKNILALALAALTIFGACMIGFSNKAFAAGSVDASILGSTNGKSYTNEYFGVKIPLFKNSTIGTDADLAADNGVDPNGYSADKRIAAINAGEHVYIQHFESNNNVVSIAVGKFDSKEEKQLFMKTIAKEDLQSTIDAWNEDPDFTISESGLKKINCFGKDRPVILVKGQYAGRNFTSAHTFYFKDDCYMEVLIDGYGRNQTEVLKKSSLLKK